MATAHAGPSSAAAERTLIYSICPVFVASHVAVEFGWLDDELERVGARALFLRGQPRDLWPVHFDHRHPAFSRDGGAIPAIWANADQGGNVLVGLTAAHNGGQIVVRADADIFALRDLRGLRLGVPSSGRAAIDWWRAVTERAFAVSLRIAGIAPGDVRFIDICYPDTSPFDEERPVAPRRPRAVWERLSRTALAFLPEVEALERGEVDAIYVGQGKRFFLERSGRFKVIEDLSARPDWTLEVANSPFTLAVSRQIASEHPDIVVAYLRAAIRAGRWINSNRRAAAAILHDLTYHPTVEDTFAAIARTDFVPNLSPQNLAGIAVQKRFLLERGYIERDFAVKDWADRRFLDAALASLDGEGASTGP